MNEMNNYKNSQMAATRNNVIFIIVGWVSAIVSLFYQPLIFGVLGAIMGIMAVKNRSRAGMPIIFASIILMGIGLFYSGVIMNYTRHFLGM